MAFLSEDDLQAMGFAALGKNVRISSKASIYNADQIHIGDNSRIDDFCVVSGRVEIGRNVHIAALCLVAGGRPGITMGDFSGLAYGVKIFAQSDDYSGATLTNPTVPAEYKSEILAPLIIGRHVIVGTNSVVGPGVTLAEGSSIGSGAVVLRSTEPWGIYVGAPVRRIRDRSKELLVLERAYLDREMPESRP